MESILTARLQLFPLDIAGLQAMLAHPEQIESAPGLTLASDLVTAQIEHALQTKIIKMQSVDPALHPWYTYWLIAIPMLGIGAGLIGFKGKPDAAGMVEFGYGIAETYQNRGLMTEAVQAMIAWAFSLPGCRRITAETLRSNLDSQRVLVKTGFQLYKQTQDTFEWKLDRPAEPSVRG